MFDSLYLIPLMPLIGFVVNFFLAERLPKKLTASIACGSVAISFVLSVLAFQSLSSLPESSRVIEQVWFSWMKLGSLSVDFAFLLDPLSAVMILVVTGVGLLIHIYSIGYMSHDSGFGRYFAYLNLFTFSMLVLVLANSFLFMFIGWEGVGLCSYLLIGFWFKKGSAVDAGKKAFIVNRIGDFGFLLGMFIIFWQIGSLNFGDVMSAAPGTFAVGGTLITAATLLLFLGAVGKSAQIPLYVWLPDAMEGPTPVSALIHAATMVTAGVYMVARSSVLFTMAPTTLLVIAIIGCATAFMAATIALTQNDIKRVLAYSTVSQLGYMFMALGVGAFGAGIFHLMTHAFFKALLFLGAGSVIHAMSDKQDMREMGGLKKHLPITFWTFIIATLAIAGLPPLSGFFSKDEILWMSFSSDYGHPLFWFVGVLTAGLTTFYMFRAVFMTFFGKERMDSKTRDLIHESPSSMTMPLVALAILAVIGGVIGIPKLIGDSLGISNSFEHWLAPVFVPAMALMPQSAGHHSSAIEWSLMGITILVAVVAILMARHFYLKTPESAGKLGASLPGIYRLLNGKYFVDEIYHKLVVRPIYVGSMILWKVVDVLIIDGLINGGAYFMGGLSSVIRRVQNGRLTGYATVFTLGVLALAGMLLIFYASQGASAMSGQ